LKQEKPIRSGFRLVFTFGRNVPRGAGNSKTKFSPQEKAATAEYGGNIQLSASIKSTG